MQQAVIGAHAMILTYAALPSNREGSRVLHQHAGVDDRGLFRLVQCRAILLEAVDVDRANAFDRAGLLTYTQ